jgi:hypothetical protein
MPLKSVFKLNRIHVKKLVEAGTTAPSGGNIQPWLVSVTGSTMTISLDPKRCGNLLDVDCLASILSLGSFTQNVEIAAQSLNLAYSAQIKEGKSTKDFKVRINFLKSKKATTHPLYSSIKKRVTNRKLHRGNLIDEKTLKKLSRLVADSNENLKLSCVYSTNKKKTVANILGVADAFRTIHQQLFKQMMSEIRWSDSEVKRTRDGIDIKTLELPFHAAKMLKLLNRFPDIAKLAPGRALEDQAKPVLLNSSHLCCLSTLSKPVPGSMFYSGKTLQLLWLMITKLHLELHPWTVLPFFMIRAKYYPSNEFSKKEEKMILDLGVKLRKAFKLRSNSNPIFIFRLSTAKPPSARSLRIPWNRLTSLDK